MSAPKRHRPRTALTWRSRINSDSLCSFMTSQKAGNQPVLCDTSVRHTIAMLMQQLQKEKALNSQLQSRVSEARQRKQGLREVSIKIGHQKGLVQTEESFHLPSKAEKVRRQIQRLREEKTMLYRSKQFTEQQQNMVLLRELREQVGRFRQSPSPDQYFPFKIEGLCLEYLSAESQHAQLRGRVQALKSQKLRLTLRSTKSLRRIKSSNCVKFEEVELPTASAKMVETSSKLDQSLSKIKEKEIRKFQCRLSGLKGAKERIRAKLDQTKLLGQTRERLELLRCLRMYKQEFEGDPLADIEQQTLALQGRDLLQCKFKVKQHLSAAFLGHRSCELAYKSMLLEVEPRQFILKQFQSYEQNFIWFGSMSQKFRQFPFDLAPPDARDLAHYLINDEYKELNDIDAVELPKVREALVVLAKQTYFRLKGSLTSEDEQSLFQGVVDYFEKCKAWIQKSLAEINSRPRIGRQDIRHLSLLGSLELGEREIDYVCLCMFGKSMRVDQYDPYDLSRLFIQNRDFEKHLAWRRALPFVAQYKGR